MLVGVPKEIKNHEYRVGLTPESVAELVGQGHSVIVETNAGIGMGADDDQYLSAGAEISPTADEVFHRADMIVKVKEPQVAERKMLREGRFYIPICISHLIRIKQKIWSTLVQSALPTKQ